MRLAIAFAILLALGACANVRAQCPNGRCPVGGCPSNAGAFLPPDQRCNAAPQAAPTGCASCGQTGSANVGGCNCGSAPRFVIAHAVGYRVTHPFGGRFRR